jgi:hypothetical protein
MMRIPDIQAVATVTIGQRDEQYVPHQRLQPPQKAKKLPTKPPSQLGKMRKDSKVVLGSKAPQNYWTFEIEQ